MWLIECVCVLFGRTVVAAKIALRCAEAVRHCTERSEYRKNKTKKTSYKSKKKTQRIHVDGKRTEEFCRFWCGMKWSGITADDTLNGNC